jgi:hypothetical protein
MFFGMGATKKKAKKSKAAKKVAAKKTAIKKATKRLSQIKKKVKDATNRLTDIRAQITASVAEGATPQAAAQSAFSYDSQAYPGVPLVTDQAQIPALMQASQAEYSQQYAEQPYMPSMEAQEALQPEPSPEEAATYELVDEEDQADVETQEAAGAIEAEGQREAGEEIAKDVSWSNEEGGKEPGGGFYGLGAVAQVKRVARHAARKALAKGASPGKAVAVAARVTRNFFASQTRSGERAARFL